MEPRYGMVWYYLGMEPRGHSGTGPASLPPCPPRMLVFSCCCSRASGRPTLLMLRWPGDTGATVRGPPGGDTGAPAGGGPCCAVLGATLLPLCLRAKVLVVAEEAEESSEVGGWEAEIRLAIVTPDLGTTGVRSSLYRE